MKIRIKQYMFGVSEPYVPGPHQLTSAEAAALNILRSNNIKNAFKAKVARAEEASPGGEITAEALTALQEQLDQYDWRYVLSERAAPIAVGLLDLEIEELARETAEAQARAVGRELEGEELAEAVQSLSRLGSIREAAMERIAERRRISAETLEDLL